jgi:hypothetical protein
VRAADHNVTMPPVGGPEADERSALGEWLACGAPSLASLHASTHSIRQDLPQ